MAGNSYLVLHLSELVRTSFISATANVDQLKLAGYEALQVSMLTLDDAMSYTV